VICAANVILLTKHADGFVIPTVIGAATFTVCVTFVTQLFDDVNLKPAVPSLMPVISPLASIVATPGLSDDHEPAKELVSFAVPLIHKFGEPVNVIVGIGLTVNVDEGKEEHAVPLVKNLTVTGPPLIPVTTPEAFIFAIDVSELIQIPPDMFDVNEGPVVPGQIVLGPVCVIIGLALTVIG
jgi:hypothetical protein